MKPTIKDLQTAGITTSTDVPVNNYVNQLMTKTAICNKGLLQIAKDKETAKLTNIGRSRDVDIAASRRQFKVFSLSKKANFKHKAHIRFSICN